jgi:hypothetical protein
MGGSFATSDAERNPDLRPVRVAQRFEEVWDEARNLASDLPGWRILEADASAKTLLCERRGGLLAPPSRVTLVFESPAGIPSTTVNARSESSGGFLGLSRDRARVLEFMRLLHRRVG